MRIISAVLMFIPMAVLANSFNVPCHYSALIIAFTYISGHIMGVIQAATMYGKQK